MNQRNAALAAIAIVIPLAMLATLQTGRTAEPQDAAESKLQVVASFYPLYEFASQVAGERATVSSLVAAGVEPHDWEPTPRDIANVRSADLLVINGAGFESWVDRMDAKVVVDTSEGMELEHEEEAEEDGHDHEGGLNPRVWLDPVLAKHQVEKIREALVSADPENTDYYNENAAAFSARLDMLDRLAASELAACEKSDFIAFHDAFAHFAERYGLQQHSIHGASPEGGILPQRLEQVIRLANDLDLQVVYSEDLIDSRLADTIATEIPGGRVLVLSPIEGVDREEREAGIGYIEKMTENIANLKEGLGCR